MPRRRRPGVWALITTIVVALLGGALAVFGLVGIVANYKVVTYGSGSMGTTFANPTDLVVSQLDGPLHRGDLVIVDTRLFGMPGAQATPTVRRVIGVGGDHVLCCDAQSRIQVNGKSVDEGYLTHGFGDSPNSDKQIPFEVQVPAGDVFLAGDYRNNSVDSRINTDALSHGAVREQDIEGLVVGTGNLLSPQKLTPTSVFTAAGLPDAPSSDTRGYSLYRALILTGALLFLLGVIGVITVSVLRVRSRART